MPYPLPVDRVAVLAQAAKYDVAYDDPVEALVSTIRKRGFLLREEFLLVGRWKSPRAIRRLEANRTEHIEEATRIALSTSVEEMRIGALLTLRGVGYPMASVFLHWFHSDPYPILDVRALESLGMAAPSVYDTPFWLRYVEVFREALGQAEVDKRTLDRALWQWSKDPSGR